MTVALHAANLNDSADRTAAALPTMIGERGRCRNCWRMLHFKDEASRFEAEMKHKTECDPPKTFFAWIDRLIAVFAFGFQ